MFHTLQSLQHGFSSVHRVTGRGANDSIASLLRASTAVAIERRDSRTTATTAGLQLARDRVERARLD